MRITRTLLRSLLFIFIIGWIGLSFSYPPVLKENTVAFWSSDNQDPLWKLVSHAIDLAEKEIYIDMYSLTDPSLLYALNQAAKRNVAISIFTDKTRHPQKIPLDPKIEQSTYAISGLAHRKILIIDGKKTYLGSANFTPNSLRIDSNHIIGISHEGVANFFAKKSLLNTFYFNEQTLMGFLLPEDRKKALDLLIQMIDHAEKSIDIALFTLSHPLLIDSIIKAYRRGIDVTLYLDAGSAKGICKKTISILKKEKISTYLGQSSKTLHYKWMVVDKKKMIFGSCNWTKAAFSKNQEALLYIEPLNTDQKNHAESVFKKLRATGKKIATIFQNQFENDRFFLNYISICLKQKYEFGILEILRF